MDHEKEYIGYEYKQTTVSKALESAWIDSYSHFGWELEKSQPATIKAAWGPLQVMAAPLAILPGKPFKNMVSDHESRTKVEIRLKRDRKIQNKNDLNHLQISLEGTLNEMEHVEATKSLHASVAAYLIALAGTVCMGFSMFSYLGANLIACIGFAVPAFIGWILPFFVYSAMKSRREQEVRQIVEHKFEEVDEICRKAHELITA